MIAEEVVLDCKNVDTFYGDFHAIKNVSLKFYKNKVTAIIGPSGCGKTTLLKSFNRMNDFVDEFFIEGNIDFGDRNLLNIPPMEIRRDLTYFNSFLNASISFMPIVSFGTFISEAFTFSWDRERVNIKRSFSVTKYLLLSFYFLIPKKIYMA